MPRSRRVRHQVLTVAALGALAVVTVLAVTPAGPWLLHSQAVAGTPAPVSQYTCDLADYGYTGPPLTLTATSDVTATATAVAQTGFGPLFSYSGPPSFSTSIAVLPASVASQLADLSKITMEATIPVFGAPAASPEAKIFGSIPDVYLPAGPLTQLQVNDAADTAFFSSPGTAWLEFPARSLLFTPYRNGTALPVIRCQAVPGVVPASEVTVTTAPVVTPTGTASGTATAATAPAAASPAALPGQTAPAGPAAPAPAYGCTSTYRTPTYRTPLPMTITTAGVPAVGQTLTVSLSSPAAGLAAPAPGLAARLTFAGRLPVTGAQHGAVRLDRTTANAGSPVFTLSGRLRLTAAGTDVISYPRRFTYTVGLHGGEKAVLSCTLTASPTAPALTLTVAP